MFENCLFGNVNLVVKYFNSMRSWKYMKSARLQLFILIQHLFLSYYSVQHHNVGQQTFTHLLQYYTILKYISQLTKAKDNSVI